MDWVDEFRVMEVFTNADTPEDALEARKKGAQGIGLTRTEHMFFDPESRLEVNMSYSLLFSSYRQRPDKLYHMCFDRLCAS